jgi:hypothetical protein
MKKNTYVVSELYLTERGISEFILITNKGVHVGEKLTEALKERYGLECTCELVEGTVAQTYVDVVYAGGRKEKYLLTNHVNIEV